MKFKNTKESVYVAEALSFIIKYKTFEELKTKYRLEEEVKEGSIE